MTLQDAMQCIREGNKERIFALLQQDDATTWINKRCRETRSTLLNLAIVRGYIDMVRHIIKAGAQVDPPYETVRSPPLLLACKAGDIEIARCLVESGVDVNRATPELHSTPLHAAVQGNHVNLAKLLLESGAHADMTIEMKARPLECAVAFGYNEMVKALIDGGADVNHNGRAINCAVESLRFQVIPLLIASGANVNAKSRWGWTPLATAIYRNHVKSVGILINSVADLDLKVPLVVERHMERATLHTPLHQIHTVVQTARKKQEYNRLVSLAIFLQPFDLPVLVVHQIYCSILLWSARSIVSRFCAWDILSQIKKSL